MILLAWTIACVLFGSSTAAGCLFGAAFGGVCDGNVACPIDPRPFIHRRCDGRLYQAWRIQPRVTGPKCLASSASPEVPGPSTFAAATRCPVLPVSERSRFDVASPIDRHSGVDPSDFRPCGFSLGDDDETAVLSSESPRAVAAVTFPDHAPSVLRSRCSAIRKSIFPRGLVGSSDPTTFMGFDPSQFSSCSVGADACFHVGRPTCRSPRIHLDAYYSRDRPPDHSPLHPQRISSLATVDRGCAVRLLGLTGGQAVHHQGCRDLSPDFVLPAVPILPWAWPLSGFADTFLCARAGTTPIEPSASAASDRHHAFAPGRSCLPSARGLGDGLACAPRDARPEVLPMTSLPSLPFSVLKGPTPCRSD